MRVIARNAGERVSFSSRTEPIDVSRGKAPASPAAERPPRTQAVAGRITTLAPFGVR